MDVQRVPSRLLLELRHRLEPLRHCAHLSTLSGQGQDYQSQGQGYQSQGQGYQSQGQGYQG